MPRYEAFVHRRFEETGLTNVIVTRTGDDGWLQAGSFLVDLYCLGVKDAFTTEMPAIDWPAAMERIIPPTDRMSLHPACARKLVEGAVAYAKALGFAPHRDFNKARRVFGTVDSKNCPQNFTYGREGKPLYVAGPHEDEERINRVLRVLTAKLGPDGFHYLLPPEPDDEEDSARFRLRDMFAELANGNVRLEPIGGFLTALRISPTPIPPSQFLPVLWNSGPPEYREVALTEELNLLLIDYFHEIEDDLKWAVKSSAPEIAVDFDYEQVDDEAPLPARAAEWARGFLRVVHQWPAAWQAAQERAELKKHFDAIRAVARDREAPETAPPPADPADLSSYVGAAVAALYSALAPKAAG